MNGLSIRGDQPGLPGRERAPLIAGECLIAVALTVFIGISPTRADHIVGTGAHLVGPGVQSGGPRAGLATSHERHGHASVAVSVLGSEDLVRYREIFLLQAKQDWEAADAVAKELDDPLLMGHVLYERYMHPTGYRSKYPELYFWLADYSDHPNASRVYRLALKRHLAGWKPPQKPARSGRRAPLFASVMAQAPALRPRIEAPRPERSEADARAVRRLLDAIESHVRARRASKAQELLEGSKITRMLLPHEFDSARASIAAVLFFAGKDRRALTLAAASAERSRDLVPLADWTAGLAAWRLGEIDKAARHFRALAESESGSEWDITAGAYWAWRAGRILGSPLEERERLLRMGAAHPRTFYGLLASRQLAHDTPLSWDEPPLPEDELRRLLDIRGARRAIALTELGKYTLAEQEMRLLVRRVDRSLGDALLALASRLRMPALQFRLGTYLDPRTTPYYDTVAYPLPPWQPTSGFQVDRALIYAFVRQESQFKSRAKSHKGARGLMQLLPSTARSMARGENVSYGDKQELYSPEVNLDLGQAYLMHLIERRTVRGNLIYLAASYNAGPGNLKKWRTSLVNNEDPLLFIESLPVRETRRFVKRVMTNLWIYRDRLGQDLPSLDAVVTGNWPYYVQLDRRPFTVASNGAQL